MKRIGMAALCLSLVLSLWGCGAETAPEPETVAAQTETVTVPTEPMPTEPEHNIEIYELDTRDYSFSFEKVLLQIDWTDMTFALKCFNGGVVTGTVEQGAREIICTHEGGRMILSRYYHDEKPVLGNLNFCYDQNRYLASDQLMFCPQVGNSLDYRFLVAEDQEQEITADPAAAPLDAYKNLYKRTYQYRCYVTKSDGDKPCVLNIHHYPLQGKWEFRGAYDAEEVAMAENPDGSIVFSQGKKQWNFHLEGEDLYYDGGSPLTASGYDANTQTYSQAEIPAGAMFYTYEENYLYDGLYILPAETLKRLCASIQIDTKNQYLRIRCYDGIELEGPYIYHENYIRFPVQIMDPFFGQKTVDLELFPHEHGLSVRNAGVRDQWYITVGPGGIDDPFMFFPLQGITPQEIPEKTGGQ